MPHETFRKLKKHKAGKELINKAACDPAQYNRGFNCKGFGSTGLYICHERGPCTYKIFRSHYCNVMNEATKLKHPN